MDQSRAAQVQVRFQLAAVSAITARHSSSAKLPRPGRPLLYCILAGAREHTRISLGVLAPWN